MKLRTLFIGLSLLLVLFTVHAEVRVTTYSTQSDHKKIGEVVFKNKAGGLLILPNLSDLSPGLHGFHLHEHPSCEAHAQAAGGHYDPQHTNKHLGPYRTGGHRGDLPMLFVNKKGIAKKSLFAPHLTEKDLCGHALMIHAGGDNYSDVPKPLGGGGDRIACGVIACQAL